MSKRIPEWFGWARKSAKDEWYLACHGDSKEWVENTLDKLRKSGKLYGTLVLEAPETPYRSVMLKRRLSNAK